MVPPSLKVCIVGALLLSSSAAGAGTSMVCGKASIRKELAKPTNSINKRSWMKIAKTAKEQAEDMGKLVKKLHDELLDLEAKAAAERAKFVPADFSFEDATALVKEALQYDSVEDAKDKDCGYAVGKVTSVELRTKYLPAWGDSVAAFEPLADAAIGEAKKQFDAEVFMNACSSLIGEGQCQGLCYDMSVYAGDIYVESDDSLEGNKADQYDAEAAEKRKEWQRAQEEHKECVDSEEVIAGLVGQYTNAADAQKKHRRSCGAAQRTLIGQQIELDELTIKFNQKKKENDKAQEDYRTAVANLVTARANQAAAEQAEAEALEMKKIAEDSLKMWQDHLVALEEQIKEQAKLVKRTAEAVDAADAASTAVSDFKDKLSTALIGLVRYYDESVRLPLRNMGIREEVAIEGLFPQADDTKAAEQFKASISSTVNFCSGKKQHFEQLSDIEVESTKLTAICDSQNWDAAQSEVFAAVDAKQKRAISNLKVAQQKVVAYTGPLADKAKGEVEGVWKAMALFGDTDFSKNYLSGWRFAKDGAGKGNQKGFMMELATALEKAREEAIKRWEEAKEAMRKLEEEKVNTIESIKVCEKFLQDCIRKWEEAQALTKKRKEETAEAIQKEAEAKKIKEDAEAALAEVTAQKIALEGEIQGTEEKIKQLDAELEKANNDLKTAHENALSSFMELLHASENQDNASWD